MAKRSKLDRRLPLLDPQRVVSLTRWCGHVELMMISENTSQATIDSLQRGADASRCKACIDADVWPIKL